MSIFKTSLLALSITTLSPLAMAQKGEATQGQSSPMINTKKSRQVQGTVVNLKKVTIRDTNVENLIAMIRTEKNDRRLIVDLGPRAGFQAGQIAEGSKISVYGNTVRLGSQIVLVASRVNVNGKEKAIDRSAQQTAVKKYGAKS